MFEARLFIAGEWREGAKTSTVRNPYSNAEVTRAHAATPEQVEEAVEAARNAFEHFSQWPAHRRALVLREAAEIIQSQAETAAELILNENAKSRSSAEVEVMRVVETLRASADEAARLTGEMLPLDSSPRGEGRLGFTLRVPVGVIAAVTPFNSPMNLAAHKLGPALAAGNTVVLKPHPQTPACNVLLVEALQTAGVPAGVVNLVLGDGEIGERLVTHPEVDIVSFTGGTANAARVRAVANGKRLLLELGGNNGNIIHHDADIERAVDECVRHAFGYQGQSCISVQRIYVHRSVHDDFLQRFVERARQLKVGDPTQLGTDIGPVISQEAADRVIAWVKEAERQGGRVLLGGTCQGALVAPTIMTDVPPDSKVACEEVFGPVAVVSSYETFEEAIRNVNDSRFGLQAGVFTSSLETALLAVRKLEVGGVVVNGTSNYRVDIQPYGGVKESGVGREGPAYAIMEMTDIRSVVIHP